MDTAKLLLRQLAYAGRMARLDEERTQVAWWQEKIAELRKQQPSAEPKQTELTIQPVAAHHG